MHPHTKADALIAGHISIDATWTEEDYAALAIAAADQAGLRLRDTDRIAEILHGHRQRIGTVR